ncbi:hypothetical protein WJX77_003010 [Trebouxia sp. C0004]
MASDKNATQVADRLLAEDWSASAYVRELQNEQAAAQNILFILQDQELRKLEPLIKVRLLLAPLFLRKQERDRLKDSLQVLADKLCLDDDDWVKVTAYAVGRYEGHLDLAAVSKASRAVEATLSKLQSGLSSAPPTSYRPLEELYLSKQNVRIAGGAEAAAAHDHFSVRAGAEATARNLTLPTQPVQRSPSPVPVITPVSAPTGSAPKDATERRSIPSGTSFIPGRPGAKAGPSGRGASSGAAGANLFMSARPPSRPPSMGGRAAVKKAPAGKSAKMLDSTEALNLRAKAAFDHSQRQEQRKPAAKRPAPSEPASASAAPSSPPRDPNSQAIWSPDTPEHTPQYTCQYSKEEAGQEAGEMQLDSDEKGEDKGAASAPAPSHLQSRPASGLTAHVQAAYGSGSVAPFALHRTSK